LSGRLSLNREEIALLLECIDIVWDSLSMPKKKKECLLLLSDKLEYEYIRLDPSLGDDAA
jgi:hypothetical protein